MDPHVNNPGQYDPHRPCGERREAAESVSGERRPVGDPRGGVDPDVDIAQPGEGREWTSDRWTLPTIAAGGVVGAVARHGLELLWPPGIHGFPWATLVTNASGSLLLGLLMVVVVEREAGHPLLRPFAGVGVLGGYTTFSTYAAQSDELFSSAPGWGLVYFVGTVLLALLAVACGLRLGRAIVPERTPGGVS